MQFDPNNEWARARLAANPIPPEPQEEDLLCIAIFAENQCITKMTAGISIKKSIVKTVLTTVGAE